MNSDQRLKNQVLSALLLDQRLEDTAIDVVLREGVVSLRGTVGSVAQLSAALEDALAIDGVRNVNNELHVSLKPLHGIPQDTIVRQRVIRNLLRKATLVIRGYDVEVLEGAVTIRGITRSYGIKTEAVEVAARTEGVIQVNNFIVVVPSDYALDIAIAERIIETWGPDPDIPLHSIDIEVNGGIVRLAGVVSTDLVYRKAQQSISGMLGLRAMVNNLVVQTIDEE